MKVHISTILFLISILILIIINIKMLNSKYSYNYNNKINMSIWTITSIIILTVSFILVNKKETYDDLQKDYQPYMEEGKIVGGTVYASYPQQVGGLGWIL